MGFAERLADARRVAGLSQSELARRIGVRPQSVQQWEQNGTTPRGHRMKDLAAVLGVTREWLLVGGSPAESVREMARNMREVPLVNYVQAGQWSEVAPEIPDAKRVSCPVPCSDSTFALEVVGESMCPEYLPGDVVFCDPEVVAQSGDDVVAVVDNHSEATFKRLVAEPGSLRLKAINPEWQPRYLEIDSPCSIVATVIYVGRVPRSRR